MQDPPNREPVLVIEDDRKIASLVATYLERAGFEVHIAHDGRTGLELCRAQNPCLVVLDLMLPQLDGWDVCRAIRQASDTPVLILSAREEESDRILGFSLGADDYVVKPFSPRELVERVKAILRRSAAAGPSAANRLIAGRLAIEPEKHKVTLDDAEVALTPSEYKLLHTLMTAPGRVFSRAELLDRLYADGGVVIDRVVDVHIGKLRQKIEPDPAAPSFVLTVRGVGYRFTENAPS